VLAVGAGVGSTVTVKGDLGGDGTSPYFHYNDSYLDLPR
jgi:hypothetical protein